MRDLRDGEHEDEVVEELEVGRVLFALGRGLTKESTHGSATLASGVSRNVDPE